MYEPLNAYLCKLVGGRLVKLELTREETFACTRVRHAMKFHIASYVRPDGQIVARECVVYSNQGAYASHGHSVTSKSMTSLRAAVSLREGTESQGIYRIYQYALGGRHARLRHAAVHIRAGKPCGRYRLQAEHGTRSRSAK